MDVSAAAELLLAVSLFESWSADPAWAGIARSLQDPDNYHHVVLMLAFGSSILGEGYDVRLHEEQENRAADLRIHLNYMEQIWVEVKARQRLQHVRGEYLNDDTARKEVEKAIQKAGTSRGGQLDTRRQTFPITFATLVFGGMCLGQRDIDTLRRAAVRIFANENAPRPRLDAIHLCTVLPTINGELHDIEDCKEAPWVMCAGASVTANVIIRTVPNPNCDAGARFFTGNPDLLADCPDDTAFIVSPPPNGGAW
jgi:hypothetical protein